MRARRTITVVGCHAGGEVGNVVVGGVAAAAGRDGLRADAGARAPTTRCGGCLLREPRGSVAVHANLIVPSTRDDCAAGYIIMEPTEYPAMSGSNTICVATVLLETGHGRDARARDDAAARGARRRRRGDARACRDGRCESVELTNVPCFADRLDAPLEVDGLGTLTVDVAFGGMWYAIADAHALGFALEPSRGARALARRRADPPRRARAAAVRAPGEPGDRGRQHRPDRRAVAGRRRRRRRTPSSSRRAGSTARRPEPGSRRAWRRCTRAARCASATR